MARTDVIGIYSPRTDDYRLDVRPHGWWQPISADEYGYGRGVVRTLSFHQGGSDNVPDPMTINVWNLRFLSGDTIERAPPVLSASLTADRQTDTTQYVEAPAGPDRGLGDKPQYQAEDDDAAGVV